MLAYPLFCSFCYPGILEWQQIAHNKKNVILFILLISYLKNCNDSNNNFKSANEYIFQIKVHDKADITVTFF